MGINAHFVMRATRDDFNLDFYQIRVGSHVIDEIKRDITIGGLIDDRSQPPPTTHESRQHVEGKFNTPRARSPDLAVQSFNEISIYSVISLIHSRLSI